MWLLCPGPRALLAERVNGFAASAPQLVLAPVGGPAEEWASAFASSYGAVLERRTELAPGAPGEDRARHAERAWRLLEDALARGHARILAVLSPELLQGVAARALGCAPERTEALRIDPGRALLLRDEPIGIVLRHSNVCAPAREQGAALPNRLSEGAP